ncbi:MAG TPA: prephenate dehydrogenase [Bacilli bacterium]|nr:prephenate dehydrogenase [Bacilli bacterium]
MHSPTFSKAVIVGCGLIGGSLARALRAHRCVRQLIAVDPDPTCRDEAVERGVVDLAYETLAEAVPGADLIVFATPVGETCRLLQEVATLPLSQGCILTDVGSTKKVICTEARRVLPASVHFIGGHPMAGSEKSGVRAASERLFQNALWVLTPYPDTDQLAFQKWASTLLQIQAQVLVLQPDLHDKVVAAISHVPHIVAAALVDQVATLTRESMHGGLYTKLAAGGFRDLTRIASGNPVMWRDILLTNGEPIRELLQQWQAGVGNLLAMMEQENGEGMQDFFQTAASFRDALPNRMRGAVRSANELTIDVVDEPGVVGQIGTLMGMHGINLHSIGLLESREDDIGQLLLSFPNREALDAGAQVLLINGFKVHLRG